MLVLNADAEAVSFARGDLVRRVTDGIFWAIRTLPQTTAPEASYLPKVMWDL